MMTRKKKPPATTPMNFLLGFKLILSFLFAGTIQADDHNECSSTDSDVDVGQMRKRLNQLLDDALSLYGSRRPSNDDIDGKPKKENDIEASYLYNRNVERRSQSAMTRYITPSPRRMSVKNQNLRAREG